MKPLILLTGEDGVDMRSPNPFHFVKRSYGNAVSGAGGLAVLALEPRLVDDYVAMADGLLLTGGVDIHPGRYQDVFMDYDPNSGQPAPYVISVTRDSMDFLLCKAFLKAGKPIFGIGRGMQVINVVFGGSLYQDIELVMELDHPVGQDHKVEIAEDSIIHRLYGEEMTVNSYHHQAIKDLGEGLRATAVAEDGIIEAIEHEILPVFGVQWHPETYKTDDEELYHHHLTILEPPEEADPVEVELQEKAIAIKKPVPGIVTDADLEIPTDNPIFNYFLNLVRKGGN
ncbi:MAG: gamma-glutamyl-gamma-aminobutyrate hydrolase family protein [Firmicutes bacterium]|nr:gamma-glutamyl-gamma-aminobutyrate hydrolase family protein [Bacillota bacterium]